MLYILFWFCMNEKHVILEQEANVPMRLQTVQKQEERIRRQKSGLPVDVEEEFSFVRASIAFRQRHEYRVKSGQTDGSGIMSGGEMVHNNYGNMQQFELARDRSQTERVYKITGNISHTPHMIGDVKFSIN